MSAPTPHEVARLLHEWQHGDRIVLDKLTPLIYDELRRLAHKYISGGRPGQTLQTSALINEANLRHIDQQRTGRAHFISVSAKAMQHIMELQQQ